MADDELLDQIEENLANPAAAEVDGVVARQHSLRDQVEFHRYKKSQDAVDSSTQSIGIRVSRFVPPGSV